MGLAMVDSMLLLLLLLMHHRHTTLEYYIEKSSCSLSCCAWVPVHVSCVTTEGLGLRMD
jgi:hypothetical protein